VSLDLAFLVLFFAVVILMGVSRGFATA
jgi:hypothetical protein